MDNPRGKIVSLVDSVGGAHAIVEVDDAPQCPRCAAGKGCGAAVFAVRGARRLEVEVPPGIAARVDDVVEVALAPHNLLRAAVIVYGLPLLGAAATAYALDFTDAGAAIAALVGLGGGLMASRYRLQQASCLRRFTPTVERVC